MKAQLVATWSYGIYWARITPRLLIAMQNVTPHSAWDTLIGILTVVLGISALWLLNRLVLRYFPSTRKVRTTAGNALMRVEATFLPGREHLLEALEREDVEEDDNGDPPHTGDKIEHR
jgi:hypothetical protein